jgi:glucokinase
MQTNLLIAGDVGGTKTDLAVYSSHSELRKPLSQAKFHSADFPSLQAMVARFLADTRTTVQVGAFAIAGPVVDGRARTTNLPWVLDERTIAQELKLRSVRLLNDLESIALAVPRLEPADLVTLNDGAAVAGGAIAIIAPGTGLGESFLTWNGARYIAHPSEGGHSDFAPTDALQRRLLEYLQSRFDHVGVERVCSGIGVPNIYEFLRDVERIPEPAAVTEKIASAADRTQAIVEAASDPGAPSQRCRATVEVLTSILASEAGNLALKVFATGGVYLAGGVALHLLDALKQPRFLDSFTRKGRFKELMGRIPLHVITARAALGGAAISGLELLKKQETP